MWHDTKKKERERGLGKGEKSKNILEQTAKACAKVWKQAG